MPTRHGHPHGRRPTAPPRHAGARRHRFFSAWPRRVLAAGLAAALPWTAAVAASASASLSNVTVQIVDLTPDDGNYPWVWFINDVDWASPASEATAQVQDPSILSDYTGWLGDSLTATASETHASATATLASGDFSGNAGGSASAEATWGLMASAATQIFNGQFIAGPDTEVIVTATVDSLSANASGDDEAQALASLAISDQDGSSSDISQAWIFQSADFGMSSTASTLTVTWINATSDDVEGTFDAVVSAQAISTIPEPASGAMLAFGILVAAGLRRRQASGH